MAIFLLKGDEQTVCIPCDEPLTVEHIVLSCADLIEVIKKYFTATSLKVLFQSVSLNGIFELLKEINVFNQL